MNILDLQWTITSKRWGWTKPWPQVPHHTSLLKDAASLRTNILAKTACLKFHVDLNGFGRWTFSSRRFFLWISMDFLIHFSGFSFYALPADVTFNRISTRLSWLIRTLELWAGRGSGNSKGYCPHLPSQVASESPRFVIWLCLWKARQNRQGEWVKLFASLWEKTSWARHFGTNQG